MRIRTALSIAALTFLVLAPQAVCQDAKVEFMPLKVGNAWTYKVEFGGQNLSITQKVTKIEKKGTEEVASIDSEIMGQTITEQTSQNAKGVFRHSFQGMAVDPPIQALRLPVKKGESWDAEFTIMGQKMKATMKTEAEEEVTVPAGKYKGVIVSMDMEFMGQKMSAKSWFAPKVGIVKQTFDFGGISGTSELEKVELNK